MPEQLGELGIEKIEVMAPIAVLGPAGAVACRPTRPVIGVMPVELRVIEEELDPLAAAFVGQLLQRIALERRPVDDVVARGARREHRKTVVVARGDRDVLHARRLGERHPRVGIEVGGIEGRGEPLVVGHGDGPILHHPLALAEQAVHAPMNEHSELGVAIPVARREPLRGHGVLALREGQREGYDGSENRPTSEIAGQTAACVTRSRTRDVVMRGPRINRQLPMLVAWPNSTHPPSRHISTIMDMMR